MSNRIVKSNIGQLRSRKRLSQAELAEALGVSESTVANWENGRSGLIWIERVIKLCNTLECTPEELISYYSLVDGTDIE